MENSYLLLYYFYYKCIIREVNVIMTALHETKLHGKRTFPFVVYGGRLPEWLPGYPLHWHDEMEIIHITQGTMIIGIQNEEILLSEGDTALIQPQTVHSIKQDGENTAHYFNILFRLSLLSDKHDLCGEKYFLPVESGKVIIPCCLKKDDPLNITITPFVRKLKDIFLSGVDGQELLIKSYLFAIFHFISTTAQPQNTRQQQTRILFDRLKKALDLIHNHYCEEITVEKAAALCNFSASYFSKMFRELMGISFNKYLVNYRLEEAAKMLSGKDTVISETAYDCGFNNLSYFTRAFKDKFGVTPHEYRKNQQ